MNNSEQAELPRSLALNTYNCKVRWASQEQEQFSMSNPTRGLEKQRDT